MYQSIIAQHHQQTPRTERVHKMEREQAFFKSYHQTRSNPKPQIKQHPVISNQQNLPPRTGQLPTMSQTCLEIEQTCQTSDARENIGKEYL